jgi:hypothetical protein
VLESRFGPPLDKNSVVGITIDMMGVLMLGILMEGKVVSIGIPQMETPNEMCKDGVGPMTIMDKNENIREVPLVILIDAIKGSTTLYETLGSDMM